MQPFLILRLAFRLPQAACVSRESDCITSIKQTNLNLQRRSCMIPVLTIYATMHTLNTFSNTFCYIEIHMSILKLYLLYRELLYTRWRLIEVVLHLSFCPSNTKHLSLENLEQNRRESQTCMTIIYAKNPIVSHKNINVYLFDLKSWI